MRRDYWLARKERDSLVRSERIGNKGARAIVEIYDRVLKEINKEISQIYLKYSNETGLAVDELALILNGSEKTEFLASIRRTMKKLGFKIGDVYKPKYLVRISRLDAFKEQIYWKIAELSINETSLSTKTYKDIVKQTYSDFSKNYEFIGIQPSFATVDTEVLNQVVASNWLGSNYSKRIWKNTKNFASKARVILGDGLARGLSYSKMSKEIREAFGVGKYVSQRLVATEANYFHNQAILTFYEDNGIERYLFDAVMDGRTSDVCEKHNNKVYNVKDAQVGINYPPLHPHCRSVPKSLFPDQDTLKRRREIKQ